MTIAILGAQTHIRPRPEQYLSRRNASAGLPQPIVVRFSPEALRALSSTLDVCHRPFDFSSLESWRATLLSRTLQLTDAPAGHCDVYGVGLSMPAEYSGYDSILASEWERSWRDQDDALHVLNRLQMRSYTRRSRFRTAGPEWMRKYRDSAVYCDFYTPARLHQDGGGVRATFGSIDAHLHVDALRDWSDMADARVGVLLGCVESAFRASVQSIGRSGQRHWSGSQLLNEVTEAVAVVDRRGIWVHRSAKFETEIATLPVGVWTVWSEELALLAQTLLLQSVQQNRTVSAERHQQWSSSCEHLQIHGVISETRAPGGVPVAVFRLTRREPSPVVSHRANAFGLTSRQLSVARLIADGLSSAAIAERLGVTVHTARRHTEVVMAKLNVRSRSSVARALWGAGDLDVVRDPAAKR